MAASVYVVEGFRRWMRKQPLRELDLCRAVAEMTRGLVDADLGSGLVKKRIGRFGAGKSGGYRVLIATGRDDAYIFIEGYAKSSLANVNTKALAAARDLARSLLSMSNEQLAGVVSSGVLKKVNCDA